jgi:hypothetical protein
LNPIAAAHTFELVEPERNEVFERIPWETLEDPKKPDRQWLMFAVAGAVVLGALAYSFMSNRPVPVATGTTTVAVEEIPPATAPISVPPPQATATPSTSPLVTAEADLYAVDPERVIDQVSAHAEWFVAEYLTVDGSDGARETLSSLLPAGVPLPSAPEGTRVFVEWVRTASVEEVAPLTFRATVIARSLAATGGEAYQRQDPLEIRVDISMAGEKPQVLMPPEISVAASGPPHELTLAEVPEEAASAALERSGGVEVVGGVQGPDGDWRVVVLVSGADGVTRPVTVPLS